MKIASATATAIAVVILLCALSMGGQQQENGQAPSTSSKPRASKGPWEKYTNIRPVPQKWRMPDGRVVEFPASTSKEEINALAKRIAEGAVELPPDARVVGWEPVEGAYRLLPSYEQRVATIPTVKGKLDALANAAVILQNQVDSNDHESSRFTASLERRYASLTDVVNANSKTMDGNSAALAAESDRLNFQAISLTQQLNDLRQELNDFKRAGCPILRTANVDWRTRMELDSACGLH